jgi:hypothetical protein
VASAIKLDQPKKEGRWKSLCLSFTVKAISHNSIEQTRGRLQRIFYFEILPTQRYRGGMRAHVYNNNNIIGFPGWQTSQNWVGSPRRISPKLQVQSLFATRDSRLTIHAKKSTNVM